MYIKDKILIGKKIKKNYNTIIICVSFKLNNIFITVNKFTKFLEIFILNSLLKSYSCGLSNFKNKNKTSLKAYNIISQKLKFFLIKQNIKKINFIFKSSIRIKYIFLNILLNIIYSCKFIKIYSIYVKLSVPSNGCKLKKHKFL